MPKVQLSEASLNIREQTTALFVKYAAARAVRIRNRIVELNAGLVYRMAKKYSQKVDPSITPLDDFKQLGFIGLIKAVERFDNSKDGAFLVFAGKYINGEFMHHNRSDKGLVKVPVAMTELHDKVRKIQRTIQKLRPNEEITIEYVIATCPQLKLTLAKWQQLERASKPQHYAPIDAQSDDDVYVQIPDDEQNTIIIAGEQEQLNEQRATLNRRISYALSPIERTIITEHLLGVELSSIAIRHNLSDRQIQRILNTSIAKLKTCA